MAAVDTIALLTQLEHAPCSVEEICTHFATSEVHVIDLIEAYKDELLYDDGRYRLTRYVDHVVGPQGNGARRLDDRASDRRSAPCESHTSPLVVDSTPVGNIAFETQHFHAIGGPEFPKLIINLELSLCAYQEYRQSGQHIVHPLTLVLLSGEFCSPQDRGVAEFRDDIVLHASDMSPARTTQVRLQIPLDIIKVGRIEQSRSGNLQAALTFRPLLAMHSQDGAVRSFRLGGVDGIVFAIPKSQWIEQLLPQLGYGRLELIEVRIADAVRQEGLPQAVQELRQAQKQLIEGNWEEAVGHCRKAIEAIPESQNLQLPAGDRSFGTKVDTLIGEHLKAALGERQARFVAEQMKLLWGITSKAAHTSSTDYFKRADAEFLVRNTMALVEFFGKMLS